MVERSPKHEDGESGTGAEGYGLLCLGDGFVELPLEHIGETQDAMRIHMGVIRGNNLSCQLFRAIQRLPG